MFKTFLKQFPFIYPLGFISSCKDWIKNQNAKSGIYNGLRKHTFQLIEPTKNHTHALPALQEPGDAQKFSANIFYQTASARLFYLNDVYIYKEMGLLLTNRNLLFKEFTHHFNVELIEKFILKRPFYTYSRRVKNINGIGAVLLSPHSDNYYHWLFDVLPRLKLYESVMSHINHFCISAAVPQKFVDIILKFGVPAEKLLIVDDAEKLHFDRLYVASMPGSEGRSPQWGIEYVREKLLKNRPIPPFAKIYFTRGGKPKRKILNETEIIDYLKQQGFKIISPDELTVDQQIVLIQEAAIVISAHGAALANLLFAQEGLTVIEIFSPEYFRTDCYFTLARILKLDYRYLKGTKPANANWGDCVAGIDALTGLIPSQFINANDTI